MAMETPFFEHAANYTGHEAVPIPPVYDPQDAVEAILRLVDEPEAEVTVGGAGKVAAAFHAVAAGVTEKLMGAEVQQVQMEQHLPRPLLAPCIRPRPRHRHERRPSQPKAPGGVNS